MTCPVCGGSGKTLGFSSHLRGVLTLDCNTCDGSGVVDDEYPSRAEAGKKMNRYRLDRGITLRAASKITGVNPITLSRMEIGKIDPDMDLYKRFF